MSEDPADLIFTNGAVYTVDAARRWANAVAIRDGRIAAVGTDDQVRSLAGPSTTVQDLEGRMLVPGFQDAHVHPPSAGLGMLQCSLNEAHSSEEYRSIIAAYAAGHPEDPWVIGDGWSMDVFPGGTPTRKALDEIVPDRPAYFPNRDGHGAWVNTRALEAAGITRDTPDPDDGRIERDPAGDPSGTLHEGAMDLLEHVLPPVTPAQVTAGLRTAQEHLHSLGITAWQDAIVGQPGTYFDAFDAYVGLANSGELTARVVGALWWDRRAGEEQIDVFKQLRERGRVGRFAATSVKIMQDGVLENFTGGLLSPYLDGSGRKTDNTGLSFVEPRVLTKVVPRLDAEGFQVHFHAIGDRAVREALDAIESARTANGMNDLRHHISHIQVIHPDDLPRFPRLGVVANGQPLWACNEPQLAELTLPFLGAERASWVYPFGSLLRAGAQLAFGSDWSVSSADPLEEIHVAVNRTAPKGYLYGSGDPIELEPFLPAERITLGDAIHAFTMGTAYVNHLDEVTGSIEAGKFADLAVIDRNLFARPPEQISEANVQLTLVEGETVYRSDSFA
jgi:predicted amidohydrolase YtcJ